MEKSGRVAQIYGYAVCLVAIIFFLAKLSDVVGGVVALSSSSEMYLSRDLRSFEQYRVNYDQARWRNAPPGMPADTTSAVTLRVRYDADRAASIANGRYNSRRSLLTDGAVFCASLLIFAVHWIWLRRMSAAPSAG
jgi:hypothetical protein